MIASNLTIAPGAKLEKYIRADGEDKVDGAEGGKCEGRGRGKGEREGSYGDVSFNRCSCCGCVVLWWGEGEYAGEEHMVGVNCRLLGWRVVEGVGRRVSKRE